MKKIIILLFFLAPIVQADPPIIVKAKAQVKSNQLFDIAVTIRHADTGWDHYAKEWVIIADGDKQLAKRTLHHPHVNEQPFTRYSRDVHIPEDAKRVTIRAKDNLGDESNEYILLARQPKKDKKAQQQEASD